MYPSIAKYSDDGYTVTVRILMSPDIRNFDYSFTVGGGGAEHTGSGQSIGTGPSYAVNGIMYHEHLRDITFPFQRGPSIIYFTTNIGNFSIRVDVPGVSTNGIVPVDPSTMPGYDVPTVPTNPTTPSIPSSGSTLDALNRIAAALEEMNAQQGVSGSFNRAMMINSLRRSGSLTDVVEELSSPTKVPGL